MQVLSMRTLAPVMVNGVVKNQSIISWAGLSTETKPTVEAEGVLIATGSTFFEMDTSTANMYDSDNETWHALG